MWGRAKLLLQYFIISLIIQACNIEETTSNHRQNDLITVKRPNERMVLYQVLPRLFGNKKNTNKPWGTLEENGSGKFNDFTQKALIKIKGMGYTHIWYTGVIEHGVLTDYTKHNIPLDDADVVKGRAGSPYAIKDYYDVNPDLAVSVKDRMSEFEALVLRSHDVGLKVIIDFVPNHVARGYTSDTKPSGTKDFGENDDVSQSFLASNNYYYLPNQDFKVPEGYESLGEYTFPTKDGYFKEYPAKATGNDVFSSTPSVNDWFETVKLNYGVDYKNGRAQYFDPIPNTWIKMRDILLYWASKNIDGFRCDMAEMVPAEFWGWVTKEVKEQYPEVSFTAEIYNPDSYRTYIHEGGFDYLYDKVEMYDTLKHIIQDKATTDDITTIWQKQEGISSNMLRFLENHDEQRIASPDFAGDMKKGVPMMAVSAFMHQGPVMMYFGQDIGEPGQGYSGFGHDDGRTTIYDYWGVPEHQKWMNNGAFDGGLLSDEQTQLQAEYIDILKTCNEHPAIREGDFYDLHYYNRNDAYEGYSNKLYAFLRHADKSNVLVVVNFGETEEIARLKIPQDAWEKMELTQPEINVSVLPNPIKRESTVNYEDATPLTLSISALHYLIIELK